MIISQTLPRTFTPTTTGTTIDTPRAQHRVSFNLAISITVSVTSGVAKINNLLLSDKQWYHYAPRVLPQQRPRDWEQTRKAATTKQQRPATNTLTTASMTVMTVLYTANNPTSSSSSHPLRRIFVSGLWSSSWWICEHEPSSFAAVRNAEHHKFLIRLTFTMSGRRCCCCWS